MPHVPVVDRMLRWLFGIARQIFLLQGLAFGCASAATFAWVQSNASPWMARALVTAAVISVTFVIAGFVLGRLRSWSQVLGGTPASGSRWPAALAVSLVAVSLLSVVASKDLRSLWREIGEQLTAIGFWNELSRPSQFGGIVLLPVLLALFVPALVTAAALFSAVYPLVMAMRLPSRPLMFPTLFAMGAVCQTALVATGWLAARLLRQLSDVAVSEMTRAPDAEVTQLATRLTMAVDTLTTTATMLALGAAIVVAWAIFLRLSDGASFAFGRDPVNDVVAVPNLDGRYKEEPFVAFSAEASEPQIRATRSSRLGASAGWALIGLGAMFLLFAGMDRLRARASFVASTPEPGATLAAAPSVLRVSLSHPLDSASMLSVVYLPAVPSEDDIARDVRVTTRLAADDPGRRTLEAIPPRLGRGLYLVRWTAHPERGGVTRNGSFTFAIGAAVPPDRADMTYSLNERDSNSRGRRSTLVGGVLLLAIGGLASLRPSSDDTRTT